MAELLHYGDAAAGGDTGTQRFELAPKIFHTPHIYGENGGFRGAVIECKYNNIQDERKIKITIPGLMVRYDTIIYYPAGSKYANMIRAWTTSIVD